LIVSAEAEMSDHQREIYHSENGDRWFLCRGDDSHVFVLHKANVSSGGAATKIELGDFSEEAKRVPSIKRLSALSAISSIPAPRAASSIGKKPPPTGGP
jgi:hypothetical protein